MKPFTRRGKIIFTKHALHRLQGFMDVGQAYWLLLNSVKEERNLTRYEKQKYGDDFVYYRNGTVVFVVQNAYNGTKPVHRVITVIDQRVNLKAKLFS